MTPLRELTSAPEGNSLRAGPSLRRRHEATGRRDPSLISRRHDTAIGPLWEWPTASVESRTRPSEGRRACLAHHADHGKGPSPPSPKRQPQLDYTAGRLIAGDGPRPFERAN